ncbi:hypothetical protein TrST_g4989 [Triparma strigata]|uniref:GOLD domain-containing protein n=1 Tax=Triparma strigata TaxID=1606541 RepID=A0A9W7ALE1_9STRA|nr:hypothetical protein TrST_g4989 [Triparma strigata]
MILIAFLFAITLTATGQAAVVNLKSGQEWCIRLHPNLEETSPSKTIVKHLQSSSISSLPSSPSTSLSGNFDYLGYSGLPSAASPITAICTKTRLTDLQTELLYQNIPSSSEGTFAIDISKDVPSEVYVYDLCVGNGVEGRGEWPNEYGDKPGPADGVERRMGVNFRVMGGEGEGGETLNGDEIKKTEEEKKLLEATVKETRAFLESLKTMQDHQSYMRRRESDHRAVSEITNERVWKWTVAEAVVLVALSVYQIMYLRSFFETKKRL